MKPIAVFYHCLFFKQGASPEPFPAAPAIVESQMRNFVNSGLFANCNLFSVGINGGEESRALAADLIPGDAMVTFHGLHYQNELGTLLLVEQFARENPDWYILYFHSKGATRPTGDEIRANWRECMMRNLVKNWSSCVGALDRGYDMAGCHWMTGDKTPPGQSIFAGNFWWAKSNFLATLPELKSADRIKVSGVASKESRYEGEVWIGRGPRLPKVIDFHPEWISQCKP